MQSVFHQQPKLRLSLIALACQLACVSLSANAQTAQEAAAAAAAPKAEVVITGKKLGMGLMVTEDAPKARSTITAEELEKQRPTGNAYQALEMLPSVNSYNYDATGLFGGGLTLRGFNSDQIGATINGVPVNDSGNFAVYPQEYVDQENTCSQFVTQGSTDVDSPQVGASGGNFGIVTCKPENVQRVRIMQTIGQLAAHKTFVRYDTGLFADNRSKAFISYSNAEADKWKGAGKAHREHIDAGFSYEWDRFNYIAATVLYNEATNNSINNLTLAEINDPLKGYNYDTSPTFVGHLTPVKGTAQVEKAQTPFYYGLYNNPFKNGIFSATAKFRLAEGTDIKVVPYYWYGFGNGGIQNQARSESSFLDKATFKNTAKVDLNGDGDFSDTILVAYAGVTRTQRPGVTTTVTHTFGDNEVLAGFWYEKATHQQTSPMVKVNQDGSYDVWLQQDKVLRPDGTPFENRDNRTISTAYQAFVQDTISLIDGKALINIGVRTPHIKRDLTNYTSEANLNPTYNIVRTYSQVLPQFGARYRITNDDQVFMSVAKNMKAPPNFVFANVGTNIVFPGGVPTLTRDVTAETSWNTDIGYRHQDNRFIATFTAFGVNFKNRQAGYFDPLASANYYVNVGDVKTKGFEIEANNMPINGWSLYGSFGYLKSEIQNNMFVPQKVAGLTGILPTAGKELPGSPRLNGGLALEYSQNAFWARVKAKSTSKQQATFANDEPEAPGYTIFGIDAGYTFANYGLLKRPKLTLNASNITSKQYRNPGSGVPNSTKFPGAIDNTTALRYYMGAPRFMSVTLSVDI